MANRVAPRDDIESYVMGRAKTITENTPLKMASIKTIVNEILKDPEERKRGLCDQVVTDCFASEDYIEGRQAFMVKHKPVFSGR